MQYMAYYSPEGGLYFGAHDKDAHLKTVEQYPCEDGIRLEYRLFPGGVTGKYHMPYEMVLGVFDGDWYAAADIYRNWLESTQQVLPKKLYENPDLPDWMHQSPVVALYPVRGTKDTGDMTPNRYYPFVNAIPYIDALHDELDSAIMALPMHWEGTAPWAPPYVWPPLGGEAGFRKFVDALHANGNLVGVYCSGIGWTMESYLEPSYNTEERYKKEDYASIMCQTPKGEIVQSKIIGYPIRSGYDMCSANSRVADIVVEEVKKIAQSGCDYAQYFDQNLGGNSCICYAKTHGHPPAPGKWQGDAMVDMFRRINHAIKQMGSQMVIGCELAAAEPFIAYLPYNDLRFNINYFYGKPVPAYAYLYHEYINNFMGNQNSVSAAVDSAENPDNLLFRTAYSFTAGDMMTVVLADEGCIHWDWDCEWDVTPPDQRQIKTLIRNLNAWRTGAAKPYLHYGKMQIPQPIQTDGEFQLKLKSGWAHTYQNLLTSKWMAPDGKQAQVVVNFSAAPKTFTIHADCQSVRMYSDAKGENTAVCAADGEFSVPPLSALLLEFLD